MRKDLTNRRFGRLVALRPSGSDNQGFTLWECLCDCGCTPKVRSSHLTGGRVRSCGCLNRELCIQRHLKHGMTGSPEYRSYRKMIERCCDPHNNQYANYGGRGIAVCDRWLASFEAFYADMGPRPRGCTIERKDNERGYEPDNCEWADAKTQASNRRNSVRVTHQGKSVSLAALTRMLGVSQQRTYQRLKRGWTVEEAVAQ